jgi:protein tyrosine phosphatase (PTP) superfamily phosphohydrolase (DUF442 family)
MLKKGKSMQDRMNINDAVTVGAQPTEGQLAELARAGFRTVVNHDVQERLEQ